MLCAAQVLLLTPFMPTWWQLAMFSCVLPELHLPSSMLISMPA